MATFAKPARQHEGSVIDNPTIEQLQNAFPAPSSNRLAKLYGRHALLCLLVGLLICFVPFSYHLAVGGALILCSMLLFIASVHFSVTPGDGFYVIFWRERNGDMGLLQRALSEETPDVRKLPRLASRRLIVHSHDASKSFFLEPHNEHEAEARYHRVLPCIARFEYNFFDEHSMRICVQVTLRDHNSVRVMVEQLYDIGPSIAEATMYSLLQNYQPPPLEDD